MRKVECPAGGWIGLPDEWQGVHAVRQEEAQQKVEHLPKPYQTWAVALALLEDWGDIPGLSGNPDRWDFGGKSWPVMNWISLTVFADLQNALRFPKVSPAASPDGLTPITEMTTAAGQTLETG